MIPKNVWDYDPMVKMILERNIHKDGGEDFSRNGVKRLIADALLFGINKGFNEGKKSLEEMSKDGLERFKDEVETAIFEKDKVDRIIQAERHLKHVQNETFEGFRNSQLMEEFGYTDR